MSALVRNVVPIKGNAKGAYSVIIVAAGAGNRVRSLGSRSLIQITPTQTVLDKQIAQIKESLPNNEIILITGFDSERVMKAAPANIIKIENERFEETNVVRSIAIGLHAARHPNVVIIHGDLVFSTETLKYAGFSNRSGLIVSNSQEKRQDKIGCIIDNGSVEHMLYDLPNQWAEIIYLTGKELNLFSSIAKRRDKERLLDFEVINSVIEKGGTFIPISPHKMAAIDIDSSKDIIEAKALCKN